MTDPTGQQPTEALTRRSVRAGATADPDPVDGSPAAVAGIVALFRKHPMAWTAGALAIGFALLATSALLVGAAVGADSGAGPAAPTPSADPRPTPGALPPAVPIRSCSINAAALDPRLMSLYGSVYNAADGTLLFDRNGTTAASTASVMKVLTAAAALSVLGPDYRFTTTTEVASQPNTIVLVGGGDPTLARFGDNVYPGSASLLDLAVQTKAAWQAARPGQRIENIILDSTLWNATDKWDSSWDRAEQELGYSSEVTALMVDGDREDPYAQTSPRSTDPVMRAGLYFADALGVPSAALRIGSSVGGAQLGQVQSPPISDLIPYMLQANDNTLADQLSRVISVVGGFGGGSASINQAYQSALRSYGLPTTGLTFRDGSGLSDLNAVTTQFMAQFMIKVRNQEGSLGIALAGLPVAAQTGSLAGRFTGDNAVAAGAVIAKTGRIARESSLSGIVNAADGTPLAFAFYAIGDGIPEDAAQALDSLATAAYVCGGNLAAY